MEQWNTIKVVNIFINVKQIDEYLLKKIDIEENKETRLIEHLVLLSLLFKVVNKE